MKKIRKGRQVKSKRWKYGAFDIETKGLNAKNFLFGVVMWNEKKKNDEIIQKSKIFYDKNEMVEFMTSRKFKQYRWWAHNAGGFDLISLFGNYLTDPWFHVIFNGSRFISAEYWKDPYYDEEDEKWKASYKIYFFDSLNIFPVSLEQLGKDLFHYKGKTPDKFKVSKEDERIIQEKVKTGEWTIKDVCIMYGISAESVSRIIEVGTLGDTITNDDIEYCKRDAEIVLKGINGFSDFLFERWGVSLSSTIASVSQRIFLTSYLDKDLFISNYDKYFRKSYFGGRTEVIDYRKELLKNVYYYDFNSLYPSVMVEFDYPDPESLHYVPRSNKSYVYEYEGVSLVDIIIPENIRIPPLPYKYKGKLIFPVGTLHGWYNHNELRMAEKYGAKILKVYRTIYSEKTINPFKPFILELYKMRQQFKAEGNKTGNLYTKLIMNSLYGKFGQRIEYKQFGWIDREPKIPKSFRDKGYQWIFEPYKDSDFGTWKLIDPYGEEVTSDARRSILCFASYITSWARIKLYEKMLQVINDGYDVYYCDTDSIITNHPGFENSKELGKLKLEGIGDFRAYAPKTYEWYENGKLKIKLKGVRNPSEIKTEFIERRIVKVKEATRRGLEAGIGEFKKKVIKYEDTKRKWIGSRGKPWNVDTLRKHEYFEKIVLELVKQYVEEIKRLRTKPVYYKLFDDTLVRSKSEIWHHPIVAQLGKIPTRQEIREYVLWELEQMGVTPDTIELENIKEILKKD